MAKKAVISTGGKQYIVSEGETVDVELLKDAKKSIDFDVMMVIDDKNISIGNPLVAGVKVTASVAAPDVQQDKVTSIRYKAKKRVHKVRGHRQRLTTLKITSIK